MYVRVPGRKWKIKLKLNSEGSVSFKSKWLYTKYFQPANDMLVGLTPLHAVPWMPQRRAVKVKISSSPPPSPLLLKDGKTVRGYRQHTSTLVHTLISFERERISCSSGIMWPHFLHRVNKGDNYV